MHGVLTRRGLGLLVLALLMVAACVRLGFWQLDVAKDEGRARALAEAATAPMVALESLAAPHEPMSADLNNRAVSVTGTYQQQHSVLVVDRRLGQRSGSWVVSPFTVAATGATVAVIRGFVDAAATAAPAPPPGQLRVEGTLGPGEASRAGQDLASGRLTSLDLATLVNLWSGELYTTVVFAASERAADAAVPLTPDGLTRVPPPSFDTPMDLQNAMYAVQWWIFAIFFLWMWWKMVRVPRPAAEGPDPGQADHPRTDDETQMAEEAPA